jgi:uncharacterized protein YegJ (DUF2314 family)
MILRFFTRSLVPILIISLLGCQNNPKVIKRDGEPDISRVADDNKQMNKAIILAKQTLGEFDHALLSHDTALKFLAMKMRFETPEGGGEHIWLNQITKKDNQYYGVIANVPALAMQVKLGDSVEIPKDKISDWMYVQNGKLKGGYTIRALRDQLSETEKKAFDAENGFDVE